MRRQHLFFQIITSVILILLSGYALALALGLFTLGQLEALLTVPGNNCKQNMATKFFTLLMHYNYLKESSQRMYPPYHSGNPHHPSDTAEKVW